MPAISRPPPPLLLLLLLLLHRPTLPLHPPVHPQIDMATGQKVDRMLDGCVTCSSTQQQRTYRVHADPEFIW